MLAPGFGTKTQPSFLAFPEEHFMALEIPNAMIPTEDMREGKIGMLLRFRTEEGFKNFMIEAMEAAALVWPGIAMDWKDEEGS